MSVADFSDRKFSLPPRYFLGIGLGVFLFAIVWAKLSVTFVFGKLVILIPLIAAFAALGMISPPMAAAFYYNSIYLLGNISIAYYPGTSVLSVIAITVVSTVVMRRMLCNETPKWKQLPFEWKIAFGCMAAFFIVGSLMTFTDSNVEWLGFSGDSTLASFVTDSMRSKNGWSHYALISHWLVFLLLGFLAIRNTSDVKVFAACFSVSVVTLLLALPSEFFGTYISKVFIYCEPFGITSQNVNRSYVGYSAAAAGVAAVVLAHESGRTRKIFWWCWWAISLLIVFFAGSKGPVLAALLATIYLATKYRTWDDCSRRLRLMLLAALGFFVMMGIAGVFNPSVRSWLPCGLIEQYFGSSHSFVSRSEMVTNAVQTYVRKSEHRLLGSGFGAATRSVDPENGNLVVHAGSLNLIVDFLVETGLLGTTLFFLSVGLTLFVVYRRYPNEDRGERKLVQNFLAGLFVIVLVKANIAADTHYEDLIPLIVGVAMACGVVFGAVNVHVGSTERWWKNIWYQAVNARASVVHDSFFQERKLLLVMRLRLISN